MTDISPSNSDQEHAIAPEFSQIVDVLSLPEQGKSFSLTPAPGILPLIAKRFGIPAILRFNGEMMLVPTKNGVVVRGSLDATLVRECVASLEELEEGVQDQFEIEFDRNAVDVAGDDFDEASLAGPEPLIENQLDIGELLVQQLSLIMDPFPRKEGAQSLSDLYGEAEESSPFDMLKAAMKDQE